MSTPVLDQQALIAWSRGTAFAPDAVTVSGIGVIAWRVIDRLGNVLGTRAHPLVVALTTGGSETPGAQQMTPTGAAASTSSGRVTPLFPQALDQQAVIAWSRSPACAAL